jgi:Arc/MetJ-type ribon-helix-helix transcriptional regulator
MESKRKLPKPRKKRDITLRLDLYQWIEEQIRKGKLKNFSQAVDVALEKLKDTEKNERNG